MLIALFYADFYVNSYAKGAFTIEQASVFYLESSVYPLCSGSMIWNIY
jgi:hypothetical protein